MQKLSISANQIKSNQAESNTTPSETTTSRRLTIDDAVEMVFRTFEERYRTFWVDSFNGVSRTSVKNRWVSDLKGYSPAEIRFGLDAAKTLEYPPTLPRFLKLCRPEVDYEGDFRIAIDQLRLREDNADKWPYPALYWAATICSYEMRNYPYEKIKATWKRTLDKSIEAVKAGTYPNEVPSNLLALPPVGTSKTTFAIARANLNEIFQKFGWNHKSQGAA